ncbi:peptide ABC transporter substrate-binding protein [Lactococcus nasutitermitis]|uniref:Peptide ABC transporter substrate-binding protein n=1 Tax=Lactococcus nasutitermitis TaxID=1652957 RepID=A0ABV9JF69_9LACT|nr:peptide ABC transporter substrate-binding protein [Lactococcus nasutitermitis]
MKKEKIVALSLISLASVALLAACGSKSATQKNIQFSIPTDIDTLDSTIVTDQYSYDVIGNVEEGATRVNPKGDAALALAKSIKVSPDGLTYTITLKPNLKWSNGDKLTAKDFVYSWQRAVNPKTGSEYAYLMGAVANANDITAGKKSVDTLGIKANSATQFTVTLAQPTPYFKFLLSEPVYYPLDQKVVEKYGKQFGTTSDKMVYDGPFEFKSTKSWTGTNKTFSIYANPDYYDKSAVKSKEIDFQVISNANTGAQLYKQKKLDFTLLPTTDLIEANKGEKGFTVFKQARTDYIEYNQSGKNASSADAQKALANQDIREALNLATNRKAIIQTALPDSTPATSFTPVGMSKTSSGEDFADYAKQDYTYDAAKAKELWEKGLKETGLSKVTLSLEAATDLAASKVTANYLQTSYESTLPGLTINLKLVPFQQRLKDAQNGTFDMVLSGWGGDYAEPSTFLQLFTAGQSYNDGKFSSKTYDSAFKAATTTPDVLSQAKTDADYKTLEDTLYKGSYINPVDFQANPALMNPDVKGLQFHSTGLAYDLKTAYLK